MHKWVNMIVVNEKNKCCGCGACFNICPQKAITMRRDEKGFEYPFVDMSKCIDCHLCENVCDFSNRHNVGNEIRESYALQHKSNEVIKSSSSGGAFTAFSDLILERGGVVYGAAFSESDFWVVHQRAVNKDERDVFRESKYVQSSTANVYTSIKNDLKEGKWVLFSGMPCQCSGLISFLHGHPSKLLIVELLCHGAPSNKILIEHVHFWENKKNKKAVEYHFRSKKYGYEHNHVIKFSDGSINSSIDLKRILKLYTLTMRPSCFDCPYASRLRYGDVTIGDLWNVGEVAGIYDHKGFSTLFINTDLGAEFFKNVSETCFVKPIHLIYDDIWALSRPVSMPEHYSSFWNSYFKYGYAFVLKKFASRSMKSKIYQSLLRVLFFVKLDSFYIRIKSYLKRAG